MFRSHGTTPTVGKFGLLAVKKIWTLESRSRCKCVHSDRLNFCTAKAWLYGCVVTQLQGEENCKQKLRMWIYEWYACYYSLCLEILRFEQFRVSSAKTLNGSVWLECLVKFFDKYCVKEALAYFFFNWATWNSRKISLKEWEVKSIPQRRVYWRRGCCRIVRSTIGNFKKRRRWRQRKRHYFKVFAVFFFKVCCNYYNWPLLSNVGTFLWNWNLGEGTQVKKGREKFSRSVVFTSVSVLQNVSTGIFML